MPPKLQLFSTPQYLFLTVISKQSYTTLTLTLCVSFNKYANKKGTFQLALNFLCRIILFNRVNSTVVVIIENGRLS